MEEEIIIDGKSYSQVEEQLKNAKEEIRKSEALKDVTVASSATGFSAKHNETADSGDLEYAIVVNGHSLVRFIINFNIL